MSIWTTLASVDAPTGSGRFDLTGLDFTGYEILQVLAIGLRADTDGIFLFQQFYQGGVLQSGATAYRFAVHSQSSTPSSVNDADASDDHTRFQQGTAGWVWGNAAGESHSFRALIDRPMNTSIYKKIHGRGSWMGGDSNWVAHGVGYGFLQLTPAIDGIRIYPSSGNILSGKVRILGAA